MGLLILGAIGEELRLNAIRRRLARLEEAAGVKLPEEDDVP
jgi:hypothetical protein